MNLKQSFEVTYNPKPEINNLMRAFDLFKNGEGVCIKEIFVITFKEGEIITEERVKKLQEGIKKALEINGCEVFNVKPI